MDKDKITVDSIIDEFLDDPYFNRIWEEQYDLLREKFKSLLKFERAEIRKMLEKVAKWPEPSKNTGEGGPGPLFTIGLFTQYKQDKERHEKELKDILKKLDD